MKTTEILYDYSVMVNGLFGRNRKNKLEHFTLVNNQPNELTEEELESKLKEFISKINLKSGRATVKVYKVEASTETLDNVTFQSKLLNPFDAKVVKQISV